VAKNISVDFKSEVENNLKIKEEEENFNNL